MKPAPLSVNVSTSKTKANIVNRIVLFEYLPECVQDHGEEDKLAEEGDHEGGRGDDLSQEEEEHGQRE